MKSGIRGGLGASIGAVAASLAGCGGSARDGGATGTAGPAAIAGSAGTLSIAGSAGTLSVAGSAGALNIAGSAGTLGIAGNAGSLGAAGTPVDAVADEVPLAVRGGRITNTQLGIQGAVFVDSDVHSAEHLTSNLQKPVYASAVNACIRGTAAKVDKLSDACLTQMFTAPATDCFGEYWGVAIRMTLNQAIDPNTGEASAPLPFDASALAGFAFDLSGATLPPPKSLSFEVDADANANANVEAGKFCSQGSAKLTAGSNRVLFSQLLYRCFRISPDPPNPTAETVQSKLFRLSWHVLTNDAEAIPFDFCVSNVRALRK